MAQTNTVNLSITGMHCATCANNISKVVAKIDGVSSVSANFASEKAAISFDPSKTTIKEINSRLNQYGYSLIDPEGDSVGNTSTNSSRNIVMFVFPLSLLVFSLMLWEVLAKIVPQFPPVVLPMNMLNLLLFILSSAVLVFSGRQFLTAVYKLFTLGKSNMDTLIGVGTLVAYFYSTFVYLFPKLSERVNLPDTLYFDVVIVVIGFILFGKYLESSSKRKTGEALQKLLEIQAKTALVRRNGKEVILHISEVKVGDEIIVKPGEKIAVDGEIIEGTSTIDESLVTGESIPVDKEEGDMVIGGTINQQGAFRFKATRVGKETLLSQIVQMVESAQGSKAPIERIVDKVSGVFVPVVLIIALATIVGWIIAGNVSLALISFVGVLVIACPCALGLATPTAIIVGVGKAASNGILVKDAESLEKLHKVSTVVMDKTGTLTEGRPKVTDIVASTSKVTKEEILSILASLEKNSEHPLAYAITSRADEDKLQLQHVNNFQSIPGKGVTGGIDGMQYFAGNANFMHDLKIGISHSSMKKYSNEGKTPVFLASQGVLLGEIYLADVVKSNALDTINRLHRQGLKVVMLTGDNVNTANFIAKQLGIDSVIAQVMPSDKAGHINEIKSRHEVVAMIGDGVNDAPALAAADVGIAMSTGTDVAISTAHLTLLAGDISKVNTAITISKKTMRTIKQNLFWAFAYNVILIPVASLGLLNPVMASLAMALSSVSVVGNSLLLKKLKV